MLLNIGDTIVITGHYNRFIGTIKITKVSKKFAWSDDIKFYREYDPGQSLHRLNRSVWFAHTYNVMNTDDIKNN